MGPARQRAPACFFRCCGGSVSASFSLQYVSVIGFFTSVSNVAMWCILAMHRLRPSKKDQRITCHSHLRSLEPISRLLI